MSSTTEQPYILIMHDVGPVMLLSEEDRVAGIFTAVGGASAHSAIVARALAIPAVVGAGVAVLNIENHATVLINGDSGEYVVSPEQNQIDHAIAERQRQRELREQAEQHCLEPAITLDQHQVEIAANIGKVGATIQAVADGAEAIRLLRTEFCFYVTQQCA